MPANNRNRLMLTGVLLCATVSTAVFAQVDPARVPDHPRVNEVNQRDANQQNRISRGLADGKLNANQAARDESHLANIERRQSVDEARHGGHLTKGEQRRLNRSQNRNSRRIHRQ